MTFGKNRPPLVPDPGQQVDLLAENGETLRGFRAVSGPLSYERGGVVVWVATEAEYRDSKREPARSRSTSRGGNGRGGSQATTKRPTPRSHESGAPAGKGLRSGPSAAVSTSRRTALT